MSNLALALWEDKNQVAEVRKLFAPDLTNEEFNYFMGLGKASGLNPFKREIWAVKYGKSTAQVFIGRDGYRKMAQACSDYEWHEPDSIYENDSFMKINGEIHHKYELKNRGKLIGAYCLVKRKSASKPVCVRVSMAEYGKEQSVWKDKPETMIKKVAEAQALRLCFQDVFGGTYTEEEVYQNNVTPITKQGTQTEKLKELLDCKVDTETGEIIDVKPTEDAPITPEQLSDIEALIALKGLSDERLEKAYKHYEVNYLHEFTQDKANMFLQQLQRIQGD